MAAQYGNATYWEERYRRDTEFYDWYQRWSGLRDVVKDHLHKSDRILIIGCGRHIALKCLIMEISSELSEDLYDDGYKQLVNIDISTTAIEAMKEHYKSKSTMEFSVMNVLDMKEFNRGSFNVVMDKGTLDSILCGDSSTTNALTMLQEVSRVLKPKGRYICVTFGEPGFRVTYLDRPEYNWSVEIRAVAKPVVLSEVALDDRESVHYVYICTKGETADGID